MKQPDKNKAATLAEWLEIATRGLAAPGKERITREIEAHYAEAVQARVDQGEIQHNAEARALAELGNPVSAAKRFERSHLTKDEAEYLANLDGKKRTASKLILDCLIIAIIFSLTAWLNHSRKPAVVLGASLLFFASQIFCLVISKRPASKSKIRLLLFVNLLESLVSNIAMLILLDMSLFSSVGAFAMVLFYVTKPQYLLWLKMVKMTKEFDETTGFAG
jgi:hypothetical protein